MLPLVAYDAARAGDASKTSHSAVASATWILPLAAWMATRSIFLFEAFCVAIACFGAALVSLRTTRLLDTEGRMRNLQDDLQDRLLDLDARNHELQAARGFEAREVALAERTRIARDIHDKVGHQLTRLSLQTKALQVVHAPDASVTADFGRIAAGLDDALDNSLALGVGEVGDLSGGPQGEQAIDASGDKVLDDLVQAVEVNLALSGKRGDNRRDDAGETVVHVVSLFIERLSDV